MPRYFSFYYIFKSSKGAKRKLARACFELVKIYSKLRNLSFSLSRPWYFVSAVSIINYLLRSHKKTSYCSVPIFFPKSIPGDLPFQYLWYPDDREFRIARNSSDNTLQHYLSNKYTIILWRYNYSSKMSLFLFTLAPKYT